MLADTILVDCPSCAHQVPFSTPPSDRSTGAEYDFAVAPTWLLPLINGRERQCNHCSAIIAPEVHHEDLDRLPNRVRVTRTISANKQLTALQNAVIYFLLTRLDHFTNTYHWSDSLHADCCELQAALSESNQPLEDAGTWWHILQVLPSAPPEVVKASYRSLAKLYHPDHHKGGEEAFKAVEVAYQQYLQTQEEPQ